MRMEVRVTEAMCLWILVLVLVSFGLIMVFNTSAVFSSQQYGDPYHFFTRQIVYALVGIGIMLILSQGDYRTYRSYAPVILVASTVLLLMVFIPGLGKTVRGARRWIVLGPFSFQPSELVKLTLVFYLAGVMSKCSAKDVKDLVRGYVRYLAIAGVLLAIILLQKDFGTTVITGIAVFSVFFLAGVRWKYLLVTGLLALPLLGYFLLEDYRWKRVFTFLDPCKDPYGAGFQLCQSLISFGAGGVFGQGLAGGNQKLFYLPDAHTDFILSVIAEELGLLGVCVVLLLFLLLLLFGVRIALRAPDYFGFLLAASITLLISLQVVLNAAVVMGALPTKGMVLPFLSYGGTALVVNLMAVGILMSISRYCVIRSRPR